MGKIIRRTVTITITESWTIVWTDEGQADDTSPPPATTVVQEQPKPQEEPNVTLPTTLSATDPGKSSDPTTSPTPDGASPAPGRPRQRPRRRRGAE